ncbi:MAG: c-type cytochrome [Deltaproteobacteria bacterium]|nr:c-type cytochrome [Deltaproteobacteria bacterium]
MRPLSLVLKSALLAAAVSGIGSNAAFALPFNTDMNHPQPVTGEVMRAKAPNSIPMGSLERRVETKADALKLKNPLKGNALSTENGHRLFAINCTPCHGSYDASGTQTVAVVGPQVGAPDLSLSTYWDHETDAAGSGRTDGNIYGTIHLGGMAIMPAYGWKLSPTEHWDIINYLRSFQEAKRKATTK